MIKDKLIRADIDMVKHLRNIIPKRTINFPDENPRDLTDREITRMLRNTNGFDMALKEMIIKPRKKEK